MAFTSGPGFPRWSQDGRTVAFHGDPLGRPDVVLVALDTGTSRIMPSRLPNGGYPTFSRDGQWVYFCIVRAGEPRIWTMPPWRGEAIQVTDNAGTIAIESRDGRDLYYLDATTQPGAIWRQPLTGGASVNVIEGVARGIFDVVDRGIYYVDRSTPAANAAATGAAPAGDARLRSFGFATSRSTTVLDRLGDVGFGRSATSDGRTVYFTRVDSSTDELMIVDDFR